jgi:hypothetical protein
MNQYPYQSPQIENADSRTTYVVNSYEPLRARDVTGAIQNPDLKRLASEYTHPQFKIKWNLVHVFAPRGFALV